jgi:hypothetical protein
MAFMSKPWGSAWRLLAALPFVLLLVIIGIKVTMSQGDPASGPQKPGEHTIYELGGEAPSATVTLPNGTVTTIPSEQISELPTALQSQLMMGGAFTPGTATFAMPKITSTPTPKPVVTFTPNHSAGGTTSAAPAGGGGATSTQGSTSPTSSSPTPTPSKCVPSLIPLKLC